VFEARVIRNAKRCDEHYWVTLSLPHFPATTAGQFVQLLCRPLGEPEGPRAVDWADGDAPELRQPELANRAPLLRRPFSLAARRDVAAGVELDIIYRTVGVGSSWLAGLAEGDAISVLGPLGNAFPIPTGKKTAILIGGGVGIPPMLCLAEAFSMQSPETRVIAINGVRTERFFPLSAAADIPMDPAGQPARCVAEFAAVGADAIVTSDDGTIGQQGFVTDALLNWLAASDIDPAELVVYSCGPEVMMRSVGEICLAREIECYLSLERSMACGMSTCQSCIVKIRDDQNDQGWSYKLCCTHGPVFPAGDIVWG
jgi:dihydroorotate dehydrogenase electron transfer subunit